MAYTFVKKEGFWMTLVAQPPKATELKTVLRAHFSPGVAFEIEKGAKRCQS